MSSAKTGVLEEVYSNIYVVMDVLYAMEEKNIEYPPFGYGNPIQFFRAHVVYILVFRGALNPHHAMQLKDHRLEHEHYLLEFMKRLGEYTYKEAYAVAEDVLKHVSLRDFAFQCYLAYLCRGHQCASEDCFLSVFPNTEKGFT